MKLLAENRFPAVWLPTKELLDLRALVLHRHQWVRIRNADTKRAAGHCLSQWLTTWSESVELRRQAKIAFLPWMPHASYRRSMLQEMYRKMEEEIESLTQRVAE